MNTAILERFTVHKYTLCSKSVSCFKGTVVESAIDGCYEMLLGHFVITIGFEQQLCSRPVLLMQQLPNTQTALLIDIEHFHI